MTRQELKIYIKKDCDRYINEYCRNRFKVYLNCPGFRYTYWMRKVMYWKTKRNVYKYIGILFPYFIYRHLSMKYDIHIDTNIQIGAGLMIVHQGGVFINAKEVGENVTIYQNVTVGSGRERCQVPLIRDNVKMLTGAVVYGDIEIGEGTVVCPNAAVSKSTIPYTMVGGVPAKEIRKIEK